MYLHNFLFRQTKVSIKHYEISFGIKYSVCDLICDVPFTCAWATGKCINVFEVWCDVYDYLVQNFVPSLAVEEFWKSININMS